MPEKEKRAVLRESRKFINALKEEKSISRTLSLSMPKNKKKPTSEELRIFINAQKGEKTNLRVIENIYQFPKRRKNQSQGNRESLSIPLKEKKSASRESRKLVDAQKEEKHDLKGIENGCQCPEREKNRL